MNPLNPGQPVNLIHEGKCYEFVFVSYAADGKHCALAKVNDVGCEYILTDVDLSVVYPSTQKEPTGDVFDITPESTLMKFDYFAVLCEVKYKVGDKFKLYMEGDIEVCISGVRVIEHKVWYVCYCSNKNRYLELLEEHRKPKGYFPISSRAAYTSCNFYYTGESNGILIPQTVLDC